ncbi:MAG TPA: tetratricopeptide repeat protein [Chthoniobacteraceae bacterium]|jgi:tetratricopeptide (TPR) repeat protein|nr:tetratricopeptide repeat protein [Chthoniobacteraceae bacterium]
MTTRRSAPSFRWQTAASFTAAVLVLASPARLSAAPAKPPKQGSTAPRPQAAPTVAPAPVARPVAPGAPHEVADAYPSGRPAAADLGLQKEQERKAQALAHFAQGVLLEDSSENDLALASFKKAFDLDPSNSDLAVKLAFLLAQRNDPTAGIEVLKDAVKASPREPLPLIYLSQMYAKYLRKPEAGIKFAEQAQALDPTSYAGYLALYELLAATSQTARIEQLLQRAAKVSTNNPQYWLQIGGLFQQAHMKEDGSVSSPEMLKQMNGIFQKAATLGTSDALLLARVGNYFVDSRQVADAIPFYLSALSLKQTSDDPVLTNAGDKLARALIEAGQDEKAIGVLEKITKENPLRFETFEVLGELYEKRGDKERALGAYKHSLQLDASEPRNHIRVAEMQAEMKHFDEAVETARSARARFPENPDALFLLASCLSQAKKHPEALAVFAEALSEFESEHEEALNAEFYFQYGVAAEQAGVFEKTVEMMRKTIDLDPNGKTAAKAQNFLGYMWVERNENLDEAGDLIRKAIETQPDNGAFLDSLGWYFFKKGDYDKALTQLLRAEELTVKPLTADDAEILIHVGDTYQQLGKPGQALQYWQKALALDATNKKISEKIETIKEKVSSVATKVDGPKP